MLVNELKIVKEIEELKRSNYFQILLSQSACTIFDIYIENTCIAKGRGMKIISTYATLRFSPNLDSISM